jgi:hypothetical protein
MAIAFTGDLVSGADALPQAAIPTGASTYTLQSGSLLVDCPVCDRLPVEAPIKGTFTLRFLESNPLFERYAIEEISFAATNDSNLNYRIKGNGTYQVGGEVAIQQVMTLNLTIDNGFGTTTAANYSNTVHTVNTPWPRMQVELDQTSWEVFPMYSLELFAAPAPRFTAIKPDIQSGNVRLEWAADGQKMLLERAEGVEGPYLPVVSIAAETSYTDTGVLTNRTQYFYRLRQ